MLRSKVQDRSVFQRIVYSECWEDPLIAGNGLELGAKDDLLCLTSAGCNVLALSLRRPRSIIALDFSAAQNALLQLKIAAIHRLSWEEYVRFLGARPADNRVQLYRSRVRRELPDEARLYFDAAEHQLARGILHEGRFQKYLSLFRRRLLPLIHLKGTVRRLAELGSREERERFYDEVWDNRRWRALFTMFFGRAVMSRLGRDPAFFQYVDGSRVGLEFLARARRALIARSARDNHFLQYVLFGEYEDLEQGPIYLRESSFERLRETTQRIKIVRSDLESFLATQPAGALSALYLSDLFEWVSPQHYEAMLGEIVRATRPGGKMVYWNLLVPRSRPHSMASVIDRHPERSSELHALDRAFVYGSFHVESVRDPVPTRAHEPARAAAASGR